MTHELLLEQLQALQRLLQQIQPADFTRPSSMLGGSTIGQHVRHVVELLQCLHDGYETGIVNYDNRKRDIRIETEVSFTNSILQDLISYIAQPDKGMSLTQLHCSNIIHTTYFRELHYNTEHAIHHMALINVALREMNIVAVDENFGVANATIQFKNQVSQCVR